MMRDLVGEVVVGKGMTNAIEQVYREHGQAVWRSVFAYAGDREIADDAVAEAFAQALRRGAALDAPLHWIWRTAFRLAAGALKDRGRVGTPLRAEDSYELPPPVSDLVGALRCLSPRQRASVILHHYAGYPVGDVAKILGSTPAAVRVHLHRGRTRLRTLLGDDDE
jgi:RNA polymerase sigma-70 factor, ECF subfamily